MNDDQLLRYSHQIMLPMVDVKGQQRLLESTAMIVGLGGLGSPVAMYLAAAGVGRLLLIDFDRVEISNLQRQVIHSTADIGRLKVESARDTLKALNPEVAVESIPRKLEVDGLTNMAVNSDVIIDASDNFATRFALNQVSVATRTPLVSGAAIRMEGQVDIYRPEIPKSPCYRCLYKDENELQETCTQTGVLAPVLGIIGSIQATEALKVLMDVGLTLTGKLLLLDAMTME